MHIGDLEIQGKTVLGPMAGITDMAFRTLCREQGASLMFTEMISAKGLHYNNRNSIPLLAVTDEQRPVGVQLFGSEPELMAEEALRLEAGPYDIFDINMGCPMPKIVNNHEGSALMLQPELAGQIIAAMAGALKKPVTVKIRKGFDENHINAVEIARIAEDNGASAISVHGRTREEYYSGKADWDIIRRVKESVNIPVIGSGDVKNGADALKMLYQTGCDAVMIARAARGNPWIFREINAYLDAACKAGFDPDSEYSDSEIKDIMEAAYAAVPQRPPLDEVKTTIRRQLSVMIAHYGEWSAVRQMRQHVAFYSSGFPNSAAFRREINQADTEEAFLHILNAWG